jgi:hypothetical protein
MGTFMLQKIDKDSEGGERAQFDESEMYCSRVNSSFSRLYLLIREKTNMTLMCHLSAHANKVSMFAFERKPKTK